MSDPFRKVQPGEPVTFPAPAWNAMLDAARLRGRAGGDAPRQGRQGSVVHVLNDTGSDLGRNSVIGLGDPVFTPADSLDAFLRPVAFRGTTVPQGRFAILREPARSGQVVRAWAAGVCQVRVVVSDETHVCADAGDGFTALVSTPQGSAQILWREGGTGEQWAVVRLVGGCFVPPEATPDCAACPGLQAHVLITDDNGSFVASAPGGSTTAWSVCYPLTVSYSAPSGLCGDDAPFGGPSSGLVGYRLSCPADQGGGRVLWSLAMYYTSTTRHVDNCLRLDPASGYTCDDFLAGDFSLMPLQRVGDISGVCSPINLTYLASDMNEIFGNPATLNFGTVTVTELP